MRVLPLFRLIPHTEEATNAAHPGVSNGKCDCHRNVANELAFQSRQDQGGGRHMFSLAMRVVTRMQVS